MHGHLFKDTLEECGINTSGLILDPDYFTTLAFGFGKRRAKFFLCKENRALTTRLRKEEVSENLLKQTRIFHCGSLSLTDEPSRSANAVCG